MLADSIPKSLFLGSLQSGVVTKNKDLRLLARFIVLAFQQASEETAAENDAKRMSWFSSLRRGASWGGNNDPK